MGEYEIAFSHGNTSSTFHARLQRKKRSSRSSEWPGSTGPKPVSKKRTSPIAFKGSVTHRFELAKILVY